MLALDLNDERADEAQSFHSRFKVSLMLRQVIGCRFLVALALDFRSVAAETRHAPGPAGWGSARYRAHIQTGVAERVLDAVEVLADSCSHLTAILFDWNNLPILFS